MTVIDVRGLHMRYGTRDVLKGVDFSVDRGEVITLLGPNGAGKTTTIEILEGFRMRSAGEVSVLGVDPALGDERWRAQIGVVLQSCVTTGAGRCASSWPTSAATTPRTRPRGGRGPRTWTSCWRRSGWPSRPSSGWSHCPGASAAGLDVAVGLVGRPELLFLDEPTAGFDPRARRDFHDLVHRLSDLEDTTILLTTHDLAEAEQLADRILILAEGRIVADGSADQLARQVAGQAEVRWSRGGERFVHATPDATRFVRELFAQYGDEVADLEVRRASLEDTYMIMVHRQEHPHLQEVGA
jgi:ABC-2 type transport system ATP-binding protein